MSWVERALALMLLLAAGAAAAAESDTWRALREGAVVLLLRHTNAPGVGDPPGFRLDDCATQRNLDDAGRAQARLLGDRLRSEKVPVAAVWSSQWCRCRDTATLAALGTVHHEPAFNSFFGDASAQPQRTAAAHKRLMQWRGGGTLVVVTHQVNINALTGLPLAPGEGVVLRRQGDTLQVVGRVMP